MRVGSSLGILGFIDGLRFIPSRDRARDHGHDFLKAALDLFAHRVLLRNTAGSIRSITANSSGSGVRLGDLFLPCEQGFSEGTTWLDLDDSPSFTQRSHDET